MDFLDKFDIKIKNKDLLLTALTHSSYANEHNTESYERLEFLGSSRRQRYNIFPNPHLFFIKNR